MRESHYTTQRVHLKTHKYYSTNYCTTIKVFILYVLDVTCTNPDIMEDYNLCKNHRCISHFYSNLDIGCMTHFKKSYLGHMDIGIAHILQNTALLLYEFAHYNT